MTRREACSLLIGVLVVRHVAAAEPTTVAIATVARAAATEPERDLVASLAELVEVESSCRAGLRVVEHRQIDLALQELVLNRSLSVDSDARLQLNRLTTADLILLIVLLEPNRDGRQYVSVRAVESLTGVIRGATAAPIDGGRIEDAAAEITRYLAALVKSPRSAGVTVAVAPFECVSPFDRLRALELGAAELIVSTLLDQEAYRVLQRSNMKQLMDEIDLIRSGLVDATQLPNTLPSREGTYFLTGTIAERHAVDNGGSAELRVEVAARLIHAESGASVVEWKFTSSRKRLADELDKHVERISRYLDDRVDVQHVPRPRREFDETQHLFDQAMRDVHRILRFGPMDYGYSPFSVPGYDLSREDERPQLFELGSLGEHLLRKSIDRLETVLFIDPDRVEAAFALAYCYSFHVDGIWQPVWAEELFKRVFHHDPTSELAQRALSRLSELYFHHEGNSQVEPAYVEPAIRCGLFALENWPASTHDSGWAVQLSQLRSLYSGSYGPHANVPPWPEVVVLAGKLTESAQGAGQGQMAHQVVQSAVALVRDRKLPPQTRAAMKQLLSGWSESRQRWLRCHGSQGLARIAEGNRQFAEAAQWYRRAGAALEPPVHDLEERTRTWLMTSAAQNFRKAGDPATGVEVLRSFAPKNQPIYFDYGFYGYELGQCYEDLGDTQRALETYVDYTEAGRGLSWNTDVAERIERLGGVPRRPDSDIEVHYVPDKYGKPFYCRSLATDGKRLFCGGGYGQMHINSLPIVGIEVYDFAARRWATMPGLTDRVSCLAYDTNHLWAGTDNSGLWRCNLETGKWTRWTSDSGLPVNTVISVVAKDGTAFAGVGNRDDSSVISGGVIRVDTSGELTVYEQGEAPTTAPEYLVVDDNNVFAASDGDLYELLRKSDEWRKVPRVFCGSVFRGKSGLWLSRYRQEVFLHGTSADENRRFRKAWYPTVEGGYQVRFLVERDGQLWFGGEPWREFYSHGFYRLDTKTGDFRVYGARDGFQIGRTSQYECFDGLWADGRFWLATSFGLAEVSVSHEPTSPVSEEGMSQ